MRNKVIALCDELYDDYQRTKNQVQISINPRPCKPWEQKQPAPVCMSGRNMAGPLDDAAHGQL